MFWTRQKYSNSIYPDAGCPESLHHIAVRWQCGAARMRGIRLSACRDVTQSGNVTETLHADLPRSTTRHERNWLYIYRSENYFQQTLHRRSHAHVTWRQPSRNHGCRAKAD